MTPAIAGEGNRTPGVWHDMTGHLQIKLSTWWSVLSTSSWASPSPPPSSRSWGGRWWRTSGRCRSSGPRSRPRSSWRRLWRRSVTTPVRWWSSLFSGIVKLKAKGLNSLVRLYMISITDFDPCHSLLSVSQQNSLHFSLLMEVRNCHQVSSKNVQKVNRLSSFQQLKILILGPTLLTIWSNSRVISTSSRKVILEVREQLNKLEAKSTLSQDHSWMLTFSSWTGWRTTRRSKLSSSTRLPSDRVIVMTQVAIV